MKKLLITLVLVLFVPCYAIAQEVLEPELSRIEAWKTHQSLGVIFKYIIDCNEYLFAHPIKGQNSFPQCRAIQDKGSELWIISDTLNPWLYIVTRRATMFRGGSTVQWKAIYGKATSGKQN